MGTFIMLTVYCGPGQYTVYSVNIVYIPASVYSLCIKTKGNKERKDGGRERKKEHG